MTRLKDAGVKQATIARAVGCSQAFVSRVIARRATLRPSPTTERVWQEIERVLGEKAA